jgi:predicted hotdog family 3-hydroxylacyl-ACP dehydratase
VSAQPLADAALAPGRYLPHEHDAVLLSAVWSEDDHTTRARARAGSANAFVAEGEGWPAWLLVEALAQVVAACAGMRDSAAPGFRVGERPRLGLLLGVREFRSALPSCAAGAELDLSVVESSRDADGTGVYDGEVRIEGKWVASATLTVFLPPDVDAYLGSLEP